MKKDHLMQYLKAVPLAIAGLMMPAVALAEPVEMIGGWSATLATIDGDGSKVKSVYIFDLSGSMLIRFGKEATPFDVRCIGTETISPTDIVDGSASCIFSDKDGNKLYAEMKTADPVARYTFTGGTGPWATMRGQIEVRESFTYSTPTLARSVSTGRGEVRR
ncbi:hypothetical protein [Sphingobium nicotianae]|uniref:Uncharacterized protein n=1 Tax=Sphingobium nicotianae TaxID=2782607 RepID=A0A9X1D9W5_9SPHN|nr:hypothetical protein [Sphingobium nicotianae]MBT2186055.1 hypothetical protein [Sphingobium nicotianae]